MVSMLASTSVDRMFEPPNETNTLSWIFIVLANWNNSPQIDMLPHSDALSWFWANQSFLFLLDAAFLAEKQQMPIL
jgi:hypothetical protein